MVEERRKSVRIKKALTVRYSYSVNKDEKKWDIATIRDISETGMSVNTQYKFSPNEIVTFLIKIPSRPLDWIEFTGRIAGTEDSKAASGEILTGTHITRVEFINPKEEQKELIREYIAWFLTKGGGQK